MSLKRYINRMIAKIATSSEKTFEAKNGMKIHYLLFEKKKSDCLVVMFSAYNADGPRYSYLTTLAKANVNQLFIKDDILPNGTYYLGGEGHFEQEAATEELIRKVIDKVKPKHLIFAGSSKGGYAAINFASGYEGADMIVAAPQYRLGTYMMNAKKFYPSLCNIFGKPMDQITKEDLDLLDHRLENKIGAMDTAKKRTLYIHCSVNENTYPWHVKDMLEDMKKAGVEVVFDQGSYEQHGDLRFYYPQFLLKSIKAVCEEN